MLRDNDIVFLLEAWTSKDCDIEFNGYVKHNFYRKFRHRNTRRNSGGIVLYYKTGLKDGITIVRNNYDTIIWVKLDKTFFSLPEDVYLCGVYMWGEESPIFNIVQCHLFQTLQNDICDFDQLGVVMIIGDFNDRIANKLDYIEQDRYVQTIDSYDYIPDLPLPRASIDTVSNAQGTQLLDLCKSTSINIVYGRLDEGQSLTYFSRHGSSVIDYMLMKPESFCYINKFEILPFNEFSDHTPLKLLLNVFESVNVQSNGINDTFRFQWNSNERDVFRRALISRLPDMNNVTHLLDRHDKNSVNRAVNDFVTILNDVATPLFKKKTYKNEGSFNVRHSSRAKWFDDECHEKKQLYNEALRQFNIYKTLDTRHVLCDRKKEYKKTVRRKRRAFKFAEMRKIEKLRNKRPKDFRALFRHRKAAKGEELSLEEFYNYFRNLANDINIVNNEEAEQFCTSNDFNKNDPVFEELDSSITAAEVEKCMNSLKQGKACGTDNLLNEYFLEAGDILLSHITDLFNAILDSGCFPDNWTEGIIVPLFKKGDENDVNNFRAVTLVSCLSKLFTAVLNKRVNDWSEKYNTVSDAQFGFKKGFSTVDAIYTLHTGKTELKFTPMCTTCAHHVHDN